MSAPRFLLLLLPLFALAWAAPNPHQLAESINIDNGLDRGDWGNIDMCPTGDFAFAFEIKYSGVGFVDDTSVNAIRMYCRNGAGDLTGTTLSTEGQYGQWQGMRTCGSGKSLTGMRANVVPDMGTFGDDLGMDNLQMICEDGHVMDGLYGASNSTTPHPKYKGPVVTREMMEVEGRQVEAVRTKIAISAQIRDYGEWGMWGKCSPGNKICGHESRVEPESTLSDDAGLVDVIMFCCDAL
ncbi:hypothetical protein Pmani_018800 [Petrolisthes manimaculis]|uniref:Vitelline membrane outer layer protein 1 n=1 Tax=Petrolisthes manimaculis TaxID=1843537 RepID=A0AAE1PM53_9EUCA|nr:hypothetical protein Pmani_018800 [Petrolisthes manimaculis]